MDEGMNKLKIMLVRELPLIAFTTCAPAALGIALVALVGGITSCLRAGLWLGGWRFAALAVVFTTVGMLASVMHLARPLRAPRSLANVRSSWLSREILAVSLFWGILVAWLVLALAASGLPWHADALAVRVLGWLSLAACALACVAGLLLVGVIARAYRVAGQPGWNGPEAFVELFAVVLRVGVPAAACLMLLAPEYADNPAWPWVACFIALVCVAGAALLDRLASTSRTSRLEHELETGGNPRGRIPVALSCVNAWRHERGYGIAVSLAAVCFIVLACLVPAFELIATALAMICTFVSQAMMRAAFYGFCNPTRVPTRFPMRRQG